MKWITALLLCLAPAVLSAGPSILSNGSFDNPGDPLKGWRISYPDNSNLKDNTNMIRVVSDGQRKSVLQLHGTRYLLWELGCGVVTDSHPVPFAQGSHYRISAYARTRADSPSNSGPNARIYVEGWKWKPGVKPHSNPDWDELRKVYRQQAGKMMYFSAKKEGAFSNPSTSWQKGECTFPGKDLSPEAAKYVGTIEFITLHIIAIDGWDGDLLVDDVTIEKTK